MIGVYIQRSSVEKCTVLDIVARPSEPDLIDLGIKQ